MSIRRTAPAAGPIRGYEFPEVGGGRLRNGMEVRVVSQATLPIVTAMVVVRAGETAVAAEDAGLAVLTADALEGGTGKRSSVPA
jgi:zinc protease